MKRVLVIDNYDSFTYNLVQYLGELQVEPLVWRNDQFSLAQVEVLKPDAILVSPGPRTPKEAGLSVPLIQRFAPELPILGVCLGHQSIGTAFGAKVVLAPVMMHGKTSPIHHDGSPLFTGLPNPFTATRYHSLVVTDLPDELLITAWTDEAGGQTIMGLAHRDYPTWGVQFHPESVLSEDGLRLIKNFLNTL